MSDRAETLATNFERANAEVVSFVELLSDTPWRTWCEPEGRTVGVVVYHIAAGYVIIGNMIHALANGLPLDGPDRRRELQRSPSGGACELHHR
jgi:hypothetical protein